MTKTIHEIPPRPGRKGIVSNPELPPVLVPRERFDELTAAERQLDHLADENKRLQVSHDCLERICKAVDPVQLSDEAVAECAERLVAERNRIAAAIDSAWVNEKTLPERTESVVQHWKTFVRLIEVHRQEGEGWFGTLGRLIEERDWWINKGPRKTIEQLRADLAAANEARQRAERERDAYFENWHQTGHQLELAQQSAEDRLEWLNQAKADLTALHQYCDDLEAGQVAKPELPESVRLVDSALIDSLKARIAELEDNYDELLADLTRERDFSRLIVAQRDELAARSIMESSDSIGIYDDRERLATIEHKATQLVAALRLAFHVYPEGSDRQHSIEWAGLLAEEILAVANALHWQEIRERMMLGMPDDWTKAATVEEGGKDETN